MHVVSNLPFNDGTPARNPIYHLFFEDYAVRFQEVFGSLPARGNVIIQANWMSQPTSKHGMIMRDCLRRLGVFLIKINPYSLFETAKVRTCTVYWQRGYRDAIRIRDRVTGEESSIQDFDDQILFTANPVKLNLLYRLKPQPYDAWSLHAGSSDTDQHKWRIVTSYRKENFEQVPINALKIIEPWYENAGGYRVFAASDNKQELEQKLLWYQSFWHSQIVTFILRETRVSTTLDDPQIAWVPRIIIDHEFIAGELEDFFQLSAIERAVIHGS